MAPRNLLFLLHYVLPKGFSKGVQSGQSLGQIVPSASFLGQLGVSLSDLRLYVHAVVLHLDVEVSLHLDPFSDLLLPLLQNHHLPLPFDQLVSAPAVLALQAADRLLPLLYFLKNDSLLVEELALL
jgi:hypothetical protein